MGYPNPKPKPNPQRSEPNQTCKDSNETQPNQIIQECPALIKCIKELLTTKYVLFLIIKLDFDPRFQSAGLFLFFFSIDKYLVNVTFSYICVLFYKRLKILSLFIVFHFK